MLDDALLFVWVKQRIVGESQSSPGEKVHVSYSPTCEYVLHAAGVREDQTPAFSASVNLQSLVK